MLRPLSDALPRRVGAVLLAFVTVLAGLAIDDSASAAVRGPWMYARVQDSTLVVKLYRFRPHTRASIRLQVGERVVVRRTRTGARGYTIARFRVNPGRPAVVRIKAQVLRRQRYRALQHTRSGTWVAYRRPPKSPTVPIRPPETALPTRGATVRGPFGPDSSFAPTGGVAVAVGALDQQLLDASPEGTRFILARGVHRLQDRLRPRSGQQLLGRPGAIVDGSKPVTAFTRRDGHWVSGGHDHDFTTHGSCRSGYDACSLSEAVFVGGRPLWQVTSTSQLGPGTFVFDRARDELILHDDPSGKRVELTVAPAAFAGRRKDGSLAHNVVVRNLVIRKFATMAQRGAIDTEEASGWVIENNTIVQNSGAGVIADSNSVVRGNRINHNGQLGIGGHGENGLVEGNEIAANHTNGFSIGWEAGGSKWSHTRGLIVRNNYVHHNDGPGLWTDLSNITTRYEGNVVNDNSEAGIFHEISYDAVITGNTLARNGFGDPRWGYGAGIQIAGSPNVSITNNVVNRNARGITLIQQNRGSGVHGPHEISNAAVSGNTVIMESGFSGFVQDVGDTSYFTDRNNRFWGNTYRLGAGVTKPFEWRNGYRTPGEWSEFHPSDGPVTAL